MNLPGRAKIPILMFLNVDKRRSEQMVSEAYTGGGGRQQANQPSKNNNEKKHLPTQFTEMLFQF